MWIKVCGNTNLEDALLAVEGGADALGFVFAPSPRQVTEAEARRIISKLPPQVETYGVFVNPSFVQVVAAVSGCGLTGVQLHRSAEADLPRRLWEHFAGLTRKLSIVRTVEWNAVDGSHGRDQSQRGRNHEGQDAAEERDFVRRLGQTSGDLAVDAVLVDSSTATAVGGTGTSFDWAAAQTSFLRAAPHLRMIVAGGLRPENVKRAISTLRPWGVDVASGVEAAPGKKDRSRVLAFIQAAREAAAELRDVPAPGGWGDQPRHEGVR